MPVRPAIILLALALGTPARAAEAPGEAQPLDVPGLRALSLEELMQVEVSAPAKQPQQIREAPSVGAVITQDQIRRYGWLSLNDILYRQPGFAPAQDYERPTVSMRGLYEGWNNNHLLLLVDGVPINNVSNQTAYTHDILPLFMLERVDVFRGPGSALYGTNATNGVVALRTRAPSNERPVEGRVLLGNANTQTYDLFAGYRFPLVSAVAAYNQHHTEGNTYLSYDASARTDPMGRLQQFEVNDRRTSHYAFAKLEGHGPLDGLVLQLHYLHWNFETGHGWLYVVPDEDEHALNTEGWLWLSYRPPALLDDRLELEFVVLGERHVKDYRIKYLPNGSRFAGMDYPGGVVEIVETIPYMLFARAQAQYRFWREMSVLLGVENRMVVWPSDVSHEGNVDLNTGGTFMPFPSNEFRPLRSTLETVEGKPINSLGVYLQYTSGRMFNQLVAATVGARYDVQFLDYVAVAEAGRPERQRSFDQISPRLGLVVFPHQSLTLKAMAERAFRAPSVSELFVVNSLLGASNSEKLQPEEITTITVAGDLKIREHINVRADWFYQHFENQIAFSATQNLSANIYSREVTGVEAEILFDAPIGNRAALGGFFNYTLSHLIDEEVLEPTIARRDRLTWAPKHVFNAGVDLVFQGLELSLQGHYQGRVYRRDSDRFVMASGAPSFFSGFRPGSVAPWFTLDARVSYGVRDGIRVGLQGSNLLDAGGSLIKTNDYPFDFRIPGVRVLATVELSPKVAN